MATKSRRRSAGRSKSPQLAPLPGIQEFASVVEETRRLNTEQRDAIDYLKTLQVPAIYARSDGVFYGMERASIDKANAGAIRNWHIGMANLQKKRVDPEANGDIPEEVTRRIQWKGPDNKPLVLNRPIRPRATTRDIWEMMKFPAIRIGLAARNAYVMRAFRQFSILCNEPVPKALARLQCERIVDQAISCGLLSVPWGMAPNELVFKRQDERIMVEVPDGQIEMTEGDPPATPPTVPTAPQPKPKRYREVVLPGAVTISRVKDLYPPYVELFVRGKLQEFDGLRYMNDDEQRVTALASYVVTHNGPFGQMYGESILDGIKPFWYAAVAVGMFCRYYLERKGDPPARAYAPPTAGHDNDGNLVSGVQLMAQAHNLARSTNAVILPSVYDGAGNRLYEYEYLRDDQRADMFRSYEEHLIRQILWGLLIPDGSLFMNSRVGSFAASATYADVAMNLREIDLAEQEAYFNKYLLQKVMDLNFASKPSARVKAMLRPDVRRDLLKDLYTALLAAEKGGGIGHFAQLPDWSEVLTQLDIPHSAVN